MSATPLLPVLALLPLGLPLLLFTGFLGARSPLRWRVAATTNGAACVVALASAAVTLSFHGQGSAPPWAGGGLLSPSPVSITIAALLAFLALMIVRFSENAMAGEAGQERYVAMLQLTVTAMSVVVLTDHLLVLAGGFMVIGLALRQLLLFHPEPRRAAQAAHKQFLFARFAELALFAASLLLYSHHGSWQISTIVAAYPAGAPSGTEQLAASLLVLAALFKCAQLPVHGWLMQVAEVPTPVSALLHGGIIHLGGLLMIVFGPLVLAAPPARWLLLAVAGLSTVLAALIVTTGVSRRMRPAWSTVAQMGLLLVECALGLYELALLHLLAHACYKAYCFLNAGSTPEQNPGRRLAPGPALESWASAFALALPVAVLAKVLFGPEAPLSPWLLLAALLTVVLAERPGTTRHGPQPVALALALLLAVTCLTPRAAVGTLTADATGAGWGAELWIAVLIGLISLGAALLRYQPEAAVTRRLSLWLYAGFYLDQWASRFALRLWPPGLSLRRHGELTREATR